MIGKTILHYKIIEKLGEGGMGIVYLAEDSKLKRQVAIKFLPSHIVANSDERKRFEIEAQAAAALNHPNIATIHAIEEADNQYFLVMEYISGKHLKDYVRARHVVPQQEAVDIAIQIAKGLQAAHKKGIVHRDIKSANIMSTDDQQIKIMDFGLAKFRGSAQLTQIGTTVGTAAYMSPEQARGEDADHRADIWSFGVVFYEMLVGHPPFKAEYEQALVFNLLNEEIKAVNEINPEIPQEINSVINKCLEKDKEKRYQSIEDVLADLATGSASQTTVSSARQTSERIVVPEKNPFAVWPFILVGVISAWIILWFLFAPANKEVDTSKKMLVVLPFENLGNTDDEYFADGLTGEITSKLSGLSALGVIARSSAMQYKNNEKNLNQIAAELGVQYVLEGTVQWEQLSDGKKRVRVSPELIEVQSATQIWSKPYEADFASAFDLQANIAATVAEALNLTLIKSEKKILEQKITESSEAYDLYLRAVAFAEDITNEKTTRIAENLFLDAVALDENFAAAYAGLSTVQSNMFWEYTERTQQNLDNSEANALRALAIDPDLPAAHVAMADYYYHGKLNYQSALSEYNKALKLQPDNVDANNGIGFVYRRQGKMRGAISYFEKTFELDPRNYTTVYSVGETYVLLREYDKGIDFLDKAISIAPDGTSPILSKSKGILLKIGDVTAARNLLLEANKNKIGLDYPPINLQLFSLDLYEENFMDAISYVEGLEEISWQFYYKPADLLKGIAYRHLKDERQAKGNFKSAIDVLLKEIKEHPDDSRLYTSLGLAYAGLGQKEDAIREGKRGLDLLPMEREAWRGSYRLLDLAQIYVMVGEHQLALQAIEKLLSSPTDAMGIWLLKLDPVWDPLRELAEYKKIVKKYTVIK